jgi:hypothetical protein
MVLEYKTKVIEHKGLRVKGDDTSIQLANILENETNNLLMKGWVVKSVLPSLTSDGALLKLIVLFEKTKKK